MPTKPESLLRRVFLACLVVATGAGAAFGAGTYHIYRGLPPRTIESTSTVAGGRGNITIAPVLQGDFVHHVIRIPNPSSQPLEIDNLKMCSGCMFDGVSKRIEPGGMGSISMVIPTDALGGQTLHGTITADTNAPDGSGIEIGVTLEVREFASLSPYRVWLRGHVGDEISATSIVVPNESYPFSITGIRARKGVWFEHSYAEVERDGHKAYEITVRNTRTKPGPYQDVLFVQTDHPERPEFKIRIEGRIEP